MQVSSGRVTWIRVVLVIGIVLWALWGIGGLVFPQATYEASFPEGEPFTNVVNVLTMLAGALALTWAVAFAIALANPLGNRGLLQAIIAAAVIFALIGIYVNIAVAEPASALGLGSNILGLALSVALWVLYPWGAKSS